MNSTIKKYIYNSSQKLNNHFNIQKTNAFNFNHEIDIFTYSFPCQDLSIQGKQKGLERNSQTRSSLLWEIERILVEIRENFGSQGLPKYLLMENVAAIVNSNHILGFNEWQKILNQLGYESKVYILNASDFGLPQNRIRCYMLSVKKDYKKKVNFEFIDLNTVKQKNLH